MLEFSGGKIANRNDRIVKPAMSCDCDRETASSRIGEIKIHTVRSFFFRIVKGEFFVREQWLYLKVCQNANRFAVQQKRFVKMECKIAWSNTC